MSHKRNGRAARTLRQLGATERVVSSEGRTPAEQIARLDERLGRGEGATNERARLAAS